MPGMDGLEVARRIREERLPVRPVVLMLSSDDLKPQLVRLKELGLNAYLVKPVTRKELFEVIHRVLEDANRNTSNAMPERRALRLVEAPAADGVQARILVAEDAPDNRMVVAAYLRREPYQVDFAENGLLAVSMFKSKRYDVVLMDIQMPELDGLDATRLIRQWESEQGLAPTPIIALTASVLDEDVQTALAAGCSMHIGKPVKKRILLDTLRNAALISVTSEFLAPPTTTATPYPNGAPLDPAQRRNGKQ
jgi:CheY-like chemotaxis protein